MGKTIVVKVGTSTLTGGKENLDIDFMADLVRQLCQVADEGHKVILVTSGAIRSGMAALNLKPMLNLAEKQAAAAVGQSLLMHTYRELFARYGRNVGQVLLTRADVEDRERFRNARQTFQQLLRWSVIPIVNENDTVSTEEIQFGDNDMLAALTAIVTDADMVILLSDVDGFMVKSSKGKNYLVSEIKELDEMVWQSAGKSGKLGTGGMVSKLQAAEVLMNCGILMVLANGRTENVIPRIVGNEEIGTKFIPKRHLPARKRWLAFVPRVKGKIVVNEGAKRSIIADSKSLLPAGVLGISGEFESGDVVALIDGAGILFAKGISNYSADELRKIAGMHSDKVTKILGASKKPEVVHRDNLVVLAGNERNFVGGEV
ncbi:MAG: glutamate 5-kinase [Armatimonadetes bacterium]|nr:glutamate 5-kinase [Armatimonadota bacterium]MDW8028475.1 glutamate 5-kinase [Armatimonadota bacterium]